MCPRPADASQPLFTLHAPKSAFLRVTGNFPNALSFMANLGLATPRIDERTNEEWERIGTLLVYLKFMTSKQF